MKYEEKENAVSPVVGVMLMLVVTIIIAAVVAAFAGGLSTTTEVAPTVTFTADFSIKDGLTLKYSGATGGKSTEFDVYIGEGKQAYKAGSSDTSSFSRNSVIHFDAAAIKTKITEAFGDSYKGSGFDPTNAGNIGAPFTVRLYEKNGQCIGTAHATLTA